MPNSGPSSAASPQAGRALRSLADSRDAPDSLILSVAATALDAVDAGEAVRKALSHTEDELRIDDHSVPIGEISRVIVLALGKAAPAMAWAASQLLAELPLQGAVVADRDIEVPEGFELFVAGHPIPDEGSILAGRRLLAFASEATDEDLVLFLLSGGASALAEVPIPGLTLADLAEMTDLLLRSGASIDEVNAVRVQLSAFKGGGLAERASRARLVTLAISDVAGGPPYLIGSGPTLPVPASREDARRIVRSYGLEVAAPPPVLAQLKDTRSARMTAVHPRHTVRILADGSTAADAAERAAKRMGVAARVLANDLHGEARTAARASLAEGTQEGLSIWSGETTVTVAGQGRGGRNQEAALSAAESLRGSRGIAFCALDTDGVDGPTDAAGALVDGDTAQEIHRQGYDIGRCLADNDAHPPLKAAGALLETGPTGTNVGDLWLLYRRTDQ